MEEAEIKNRLKEVRIKIRKQEAKIRYHSLGFLAELDESTFKEKLKSILADFDNCQDTVIQLITDLEEEKSSKDKVIKDLESKLKKTWEISE